MRRTASQRPSSPFADLSFAAPVSAFAALAASADKPAASPAAGAAVAETGASTRRAGLRENVAAGAADAFCATASAFAAPAASADKSSVSTESNPWALARRSREQAEPEVRELGRQHVPLGPERDVEEEHPLLPGPARRQLPHPVEGRGGVAEEERFLAGEGEDRRVAQDVDQGKVKVLEIRAAGGREANRVRAGPAPSRIAAEARSIAASTPTSPSIPSTSAAVTLPPPETAACSKRDCPSRIDPKAYRAMRARASSSAEIPSARAISDSPPHFGVGQHAEIEPLHAGEDRVGDAVGLRGCEDEHHVGRRFLERLQQPVEGLLRQHVDLVDDVDLVPEAGGGVGGVLAQAADVVDAGVGGPVDLLDVGPGADLRARGHVRHGVGWALFRS